MKTIRWIVFAALTGCLCSSALSQVLILSGQITAHTGIYASTIATGDPVLLTLDFSSRPSDIFNGTLSGEARFNVPAAFTVNGVGVVMAPFSFFLAVSLHDDLLTLPRGEGLYANNAWKNGTDDPNSVSQFSQYLLSEKDILSSRGLFPVAIPSGGFFDRHGSYLNNTPDFQGQIDWQIESYQGFALGIVPDLPPPPPLNPVPEPATYGIVGALGLVGLVLFRRRAAAGLSCYKNN